ncbi:MAG: hypothetical protein IJM15_01910 [Erysipelotrichaceae bacterium]|nr:hypothetical protein [Erysipelotrichaceae bacterium]
MSEEIKEFHISNGLVEAVISNQAAEVRSFKSVKDQIEMVWQRNPEFWFNCNPTLFPFIGRLNQEDCFEYEGKQYTMTQHGFARRALFDVDYVKEDEVQVSLTDENDDIYHKYYPFHFRLSVNFKLDGYRLDIRHHLYNLETEKKLPFEIGFHPAFNVPMTQDKKFEDYWLIFEKEEQLVAGECEFGTSDRLRIIDGMDGPRQSFFFRNHQIKSDYVDLTDGEHTLRLGIKDYETIGVWRRNDVTPFISIEPQYPAALNDLPQENVLRKDRPNPMLKAGSEFETYYCFEIV